MVLIAAAIGGIAKWFGSERRGGDDEAQAPGDSPIVRAMFKAVNEGDLAGFKEHVDKNCRIAINSIEVTREGKLDHGIDLWADAINDMRATHPDLHWELYDELSGKDDGKDKIAIRLVSTVTDDGELQEFEVGGFGIVKDEKLVEWHQTADLEIYNQRRQMSGEETLGD
jgi:limonene-1,2-epoxide hydrolase